MTDATRLLNSMGEGDPKAAAALLPLVYQELRSLAQAQMRHERGDHTLQATALVHEAYVRLVGQEQTSWDGRRHFFAAAAESMRRILIDRARSRGRMKRGGGARRVNLTDLYAETPEADENLLALDKALETLSGEDPAKAELVKLRFFAGLSLQEAAEALGISRATASRHWTYARARLFQLLTGEPPTDASRISS